MLKIVLPGNPIAKQRHRHFLRGKYVQTYDPQKKDIDKVRLQYKEKMAQEGIKFAHCEALCLEMTFYLPQPVSRSWFEIEAFSKPDIDNLAKFYMDAANGILWHDDKQVTELYLKKIWCYIPRVEINVMQKGVYKLDPAVEKILDIFDPQKINDLLRDISTLSKTLEFDLSKPQSYSSQHLESMGYYLAYFGRKWSKDFNKISKIQEKNV